MSNICGCPNPPGGTVTCRDDQLAICAYQNGEIVSGCFDRPGTGGFMADAKKNLALANWVLSRITGIPRSDDELIEPNLIAMLRSGHYSNAEKGMVVEFSLPKDLELEMLQDSPPADFSSLFLKGVEQAAEFQKKSLEAALQQNAEIYAAYKESTQSLKATPDLFDLAAKALESYVEAQKTVIEQIVQQTTALVEKANRGGAPAQNVADTFTKSIERSIERTVEAQKEALKLAAQQAKAKGR